MRDLRELPLSRRTFLAAVGMMAAALVTSSDRARTPTVTGAPRTISDAGQSTMDMTTPEPPAQLVVPMREALPFTPDQPLTPDQPPVIAAAPVPPSGSRLQDQPFASATMGREMPCFVYLPAGYAESGIRYPTLYMLHGYGGSNTEWIGYGLPEIADRMINAGQIPPMLIVLPQGDQAYWVNHANDGQRWGDYTAQDVVRYVDTTYRTIPDGNHRAIGGLSMGAHGAMQLAMNYPGTFGAVGMHSPTLRDYQSMNAFTPFFGDEAYFDAHDPVHLVQRYPDRARALRLWLDVGAEDTDWHDSSVAFHDLLTRYNIAHEWHDTWPGIHDGAYWGGHSADYTRFYAAALSGRDDTLP